MSAFLVKMIGIFTTVIIFFESVSGAVMPDRPKDIEQCKNVIFMIGDGMGFNSIEKTGFEDGISEFNMDKFPLKGESKTASANNTVTDSAAGGSALATATRINNDCVGVYSYDQNGVYSVPVNLTELAVSMGKLAGVITTDSTSGATPAAFSAHTSSRKNEEDITEQQLASELTLIWGTVTPSFTVEECTDNGFTPVFTKTQMDALSEGERSFAQFDGEIWLTQSDAEDDLPTLAQMTEKAIDLLDDGEEGFFLMVEGAHIDKKNHANNGEGMKEALKSFDTAVGIALEYARSHGDTLVVVTADHETGGIKKKGNEYKYTSGSHTGKNVPLRVYGCDNFIKNGEKIKNKEVSRRVSRAMGCEDFPCRSFVNRDENSCSPEANMNRKKIILASDLHLCDQAWLGVAPDTRMQKFIDDIKDEYEKEPFEALLLLGDYSLDHWKWQTQGSYINEGVSNTKNFVDKYLSQLSELPIEIRMIPGNHEQYGEKLWNELTGHKRQELYVSGDWLFILMDTYQDGLNPTEHSDGIYTGADVDFIRCAMLKYPGKKVIICSHYIEPWKDTKAFCRILKNDRVKCLFAGHTHRSEVWHMEEEYGSKCVIFTGQYGEPGVTPPTDSMWGYRRLIITDEYLESCYVTPENTIVYNGETIVHPYGEQDAVTVRF